MEDDLQKRTILLQIGDPPPRDPGHFYDKLTGSATGLSN